MTTGAEENSRNPRKGKDQGAHHLLHPAQEADQDLSSPRTEERKLKKEKNTRRKKKTLPTQSDVDMSELLNSEPENMER